MAKAYGLCALCKIPKMLNYARLCKRCNNMKAGGAISGKMLDQVNKELAADKKEQAKVMESATSDAAAAASESSDEPKAEAPAEE